MAQIKVITLTAEQQTELEHAFRTSQSAAFRKRCQIILLKSQPSRPRSSLEVAGIVGCCEVVVNNWMARYEQEGIAGLHTKPGRGRKAILQDETDLVAIRQAVRGNRQRLRVAKADLEEALDKSFSHSTLRPFLKDTMHAINAFENVPVKSRRRSSTS